MKAPLLALAVLCTIACIVQVQCHPGYPSTSKKLTYPRQPFHRFRRESPEETQVSTIVKGSQSLSGLHRHPSLNINYDDRHHIVNNKWTKVHAFRNTKLRDYHFRPQPRFWHRQGQMKSAFRENAH